MPAAAAGRLSQPGQIVVHSLTIEPERASSPLPYSVECDPAEQLVSGGYNAGSDVQVTFSYPSGAKGTPVTGGHPTAWTIGVINNTKSNPPVQISAACLAGGGDTVSSVSSTTETHFEATSSVAASCPDGTVRAGGGYSSEWNPVLGTGMITGSYPLPRQGWAVDVALRSGDPDTQPRATVTAYAVCLSGEIAVADLSPVQMTLAGATAICTSAGPLLQSTCITPWKGSQQLNCFGDQVLSGGGYQVTSGNLPGFYPVLVNTPTPQPAWQLNISGSTPDTAPIIVNATPVCLVAVVTSVTTAPTAAGGGGGAQTTIADPAAGGSDLRPLAFVGGGLLLLLVLLLGALALGRSSRRRSRAGGRVQVQQQGQPAAGVGLDAVLRAHRSSYRLDEFRETI